MFLFQIRRDFLIKKKMSFSRISAVQGTKLEKVRWIQCQQQQQQTKTREAAHCLFVHTDTCIYTSSVPATTTTTSAFVWLFDQQQQQATWLLLLLLLLLLAACYDSVAGGGWADRGEATTTRGKQQQPGSSIMHFHRLPLDKISVCPEGWKVWNRPREIYRLLSPSLVGRPGARFFKVWMQASMDAFQSSYLQQVVVWCGTIQRN